jgi:hypothetical protein
MKPIVKIAAVFLCAAFSLATLVSAASSVSQCTDPSKPCFANTPTDQGPLSTTAQIVGVINQFLFYFSAVFWIAAAGFVFYAAYLYLTAAGNKELLGKAKKQLLYAVIAMVIGLMAAGLPSLINAFLSGS